MITSPSFSGIVPPCPSQPLRRIQPHDLVETAPADVERRVRDQLDDLGFREVLSQLRPLRVVDFLVIDRELLGEVEGRAFTRCQQIRALVVDRGDLRFRRSRMPGPGIAQGESVATGVQSRDLDPHELAQRRIDRALFRERATKRREGLEHARILPVGSGAHRGPRLALGVLAQVPDVFVDLVDPERFDPRHEYLLSW